WAQHGQNTLPAPASSSPEITQAGKYIFRVYPSDTLEGAYMAQLAIDELHLKRILVRAIDNASGRELASAFSKALPSSTPVEVRFYAAHGADFAALAEQARAWKPDGIYLAGYYS